MHPQFYTHTLTRPHTHYSDRLLDKPLTFTLQSLRSISRPFFHVMFTSLWAIWPQWGDCLWSTNCVCSGHFPCLGPSGEAIKAAQPSVTFYTHWKEGGVRAEGTKLSEIRFDCLCVSLGFKDLGTLLCHVRQIIVVSSLPHACENYTWRTIRDGK